MPSYRLSQLESQLEFSDATLRNVVGFEQTLHENLAGSILDYQNNGTKILDQCYLGTKIPQKIDRKAVFGVFLSSTSCF